MAVKVNGQVVQLLQPADDIVIEIDNSEELGSDPEFRLTDRNELDPAGRFRIRVSGDAVTIQRAATADWATATTILEINGTGLGVFATAPAAQPAAIADAAGGATIDAEGRAALNALLAGLRLLGIIAT